MDLLSLIVLCAPAVDVSTMQALVQAESQGQPYAIGDNRTGQSHWPKSKTQAVSVARELQRQGHSLDVGLGQINTANFTWLGLDFDGAFDPCRNLQAAETVLVADYHRTDEKAGPKQRLRQTLSRYNTGSPSKGLNNGYVARVVTAAQTPVVPPISVLIDPAPTIRVLQESPHVFDSIPDGFE